MLFFFVGVCYSLTWTAGDVARGFADVLRFGEGIAEAVDACSGWEAAGHLLTDVVRGASIATMAYGGTSALKGRTKIGYHATHPEAAESIVKGGFRPGTKPGRLGSKGIYVNDTKAGAIAEFQYHNPGIKPSVIKVKYKPGTNAYAKTPPKNYVDTHPLNVDSISSPSVRMKGTNNTNILNKSAKPIGVT